MNASAMDRAEQVAAHVDAAAQSIRAANHLTFGGLVVPTWHYRTLGGLVELAGRVGQVLEHVERCTDRAPAAHYRCGDGRRAGEVLVAVANDLDDARVALDRVDTALNAAWSGLGALAYLDPDGPDGEDDDGQGGDGGRVGGVR